MQTNNLLIFNPKDKPFGPLSINANIPIIIDRLRYPTVTHYIYSSLLNESTYANTVRLQTTTKQAVETSNELYRKQGDEDALKAIKEGTYARFSQIPDVRFKLLETGNTRLYYLDNSPKLGVADGTGENIIGRVLESVRTQIRGEVEGEKGDKTGEIYNTYLAKEILSRYLKEGKDISGYENKSYQDIIDEYGYSKITDIVPEKDIIINQYNRKRLDNITTTEIDNPGNLVGLLKKENLSKLRKTNLEYVSRIIFDRYTTDVVKRNFPNITDISLAKNQQFSKLTPSDLSSLISRISGLYYNDKLPKDVSQTISRDISDINIPTEEEVVEAESYKVKEKIIPRKAPLLTGSISFGPDPYYDENGFLSPFSEEGGPFQVGNFKYPSLMHYIFVNAISKLKEAVPDGIREAHSKIILESGGYVVNIDYIRNLYLNLEKEDRDLRMIKALRKGNDVKFESRELQNLLLSTGNTHIIYSDFSNPVLGFSKRTGGENQVGIYLEIIRERLKAERGSEAEKFTFILKASDDPEIKKWYQYKTIDAISTCLILKEYVENKAGKSNVVGQASIQDIFEQNGIFVPSSFEPPPISKDFVILVDEYLQLEDTIILEDSVALLWKHIAHIAEENNIPLTDKEWIGTQSFVFLDAIVKLNKERNIPGAITDTLVKYVVNEMYLPCSNLQEGYTISPVSSEYDDFVRNQVAKFGANIADRAIFELWKYVSLLSKGIVFEMVNNSLTFQQQIDKILDTTYKEDVKCKNIFGSRTKNCIFTALYNIIVRIDIYGKRYGIPFNLTDDVIERAANILIGNSVPEIDSLSIREESGDSIQKMKSKFKEILDPKQLRTVDRQISKLLWVVYHIYDLSRDNINIRSRIIFFAEDNTT